MAIIIIVMLYYAGSGLKSNNYKYNDLLNDLQNGKVTQLNISQNKEVPTGKVTVKLQDGSTKYVYITDVNQVISDIKDINDKTNQNIQPSIADVSRDSVFLTNILPMLLMGVVIVVVIMMMNANAAGGNSKMANFGKSRAKMVVEVIPFFYNSTGKRKNRHYTSCSQEIQGYTASFTGTIQYY